MRHSIVLGIAPVALLGLAITGVAVAPHLTSASPACAARRRHPGPTAATRSALRADPGHRRLPRRAHKPAEEAQPPRTRLTDPAPFRDDLRIYVRPAGNRGVSRSNVAPVRRLVTDDSPVMPGQVATRLLPSGGVSRIGVVSQARKRVCRCIRGRVAPLVARESRSRMHMMHDRQLFVRHMRW